MEGFQRPLLSPASAYVDRFHTRTIHLHLLSQKRMPSYTLHFQQHPSTTLLTLNLSLKRVKDPDPSLFSSTGMPYYLRRRTTRLSSSSRTEIVCEHRFFRDLPTPCQVFPLHGKMLGCQPGRWCVGRKHDRTVVKAGQFCHC